jgi:zinc/manganese transport system substrate-binding protein
VTRSCAARIALVTVGAAVAATVLTACGGSSPGSDGSGRPTVLASTDVWGSVATAVAGPDARVDSIITDPTHDPNSYQTSPADAAEIQDAGLVVVNGGHYDEFAEKAAAGRGKPTIDAFALRPEALRGDDNEHVWYNLDTVDAVAVQVATDLARLDPAHAQGYTDRATAFRSALKNVAAITAAIATAHPRAPVLQTEPIGHYLLLAAAAEDRTPHAFEEAIEQGTDPAPADVATVQDLLRGKQVRALVDNIQTEDKTTRELADLAKSSGVPVVDVTETLPQGLDFLQWQTRNAQALAAALA